MIKSLNDLMEQVKSKEKKTISVAAAEDLEIVEVVQEASRLGLAEFILVGDKKKLKGLHRITA